MKTFRAMGCVAVMLLFLACCVPGMVVVGQQRPGYTDDQMEFKTDDVGNKWARLKGEEEWGRVGSEKDCPICQENRRQLPTTAEIGDDPRSSSGTGALSASKKATAQNAVRKLVATAPKPPDTANGGEKRWEYTEKRIDELNQRLISLELVLNDFVKLLEEMKK